MKRSIITITDSEGSVIKRREFSKDQSSEALDFWLVSYLGIPKRNITQNLGERRSLLW